ncbi:MAG TPA: hypothetical protein DCS91_07975 [Microcoleaceae bacterium UBA11344]|nr:hypothetical protein [Microcoleaceae cyanobacterium UBA11344]
MCGAIGQKLKRLFSNLSLNLLELCLSRMPNFIIYFFPSHSLHLSQILRVNLNSERAIDI